MKILKLFLTPIFIFAMFFAAGILKLGKSGESVSNIDFNQLVARADAPGGGDGGDGGGGAGGSCGNSCSTDCCD